MTRKLCISCNRHPRHAKGLCLLCDKQAHPEKYSIKRSNVTANRNKKLTEAKNTLKHSGIKKKPRRATGELKLMLDLWHNRAKGFCEITGKPLGEFKPHQCMHILSKGAYGKFRLRPDNLLCVVERLHTLYDCSSKEKLLKEFPEAHVIYEMKDRLRYAYYND